MSDDPIVNVLLPLDLHSAAKTRAEQDDRSMASVIRSALRLYIRSPLPPGSKDQPRATHTTAERIR